MTRISICKLATTLVLGLTMFAAVGCSDSAAGLTLTSIKDHKKFADSFSNAYATHNANGDLDVVMVDDATERALASGKSIGPVHQIMHIRILWHPTRDMKADDPADSNASIHWYVMGAGVAQRDQMIQYSGTAFVYTGKSWSNKLKLEIQNATLKPTFSRGALNDPIGPSRVEGTVYARNNGAVVRQLLAQIRDINALARR